MALETAAAAAAASCSIFYSRGFPIHNNNKNPNPSSSSSSSSSSSRGIIHQKTFQIPYFSSTPTPPLMRRYFSCNKTNSHHHRCIATAAAASSSSESEATEEGDGNLSQQFAILLEVEGVLMDVNRVGYRQAFNLAFQKLGLDCANWTEPIYLDLVRKTGGDEEKMLVLFFNRIGWPTSLPTNEKETFMKSVLKEKKIALDEFVMAKSLPLRPGVENFIDDALNGGIPVVVLTAYSKNGDKLTRSIAEKLGPERISRIKIVGKEETENSFYGQLVLGKGVSLGLDEQLAKEARKAASAQKQKIAKEVASLLKVSIDLDTSSTESLEKTVATLRAGAEYAEVPVSNCVLVAGSQTGVVGAERIGMPCVVLRSSLTSRAEFPSAKATMDGFGGADLTISKLRQKSLS